MRILAVHPGSEYAIGDVYNGLLPSLQACGVECVPYALSARIDRAASWLRYLWTVNGEEGPAPNDADVAYQAGIGAIERALRLQPDWVFVFSGMYLHPDVIIMLRRAGLKIALLLTESPYESESERNLLKWAEVAWTNERTCVKSYREINPNVQYLPHAYDPVRHRPAGPRSYPADHQWTEAELDEWMDGDTPSHDVVFVGTPFPERVELLEQIDWTGIDLGLYGFWDEVIAADSPLRGFQRADVVSNDRAAALYRRAKIGLNLYRTSKDFESGVRIMGAESLNPRALELAACGAFQISDWRAEVEEVFGETVPTFRRPAELQVLLRRYLDRPDRRAALAHGASTRITGRTFAERADQVLADIARVSLVAAS